jgi:signal transduction histidine kinase/ActR/RegA family two-component response regulator
MSAGPPEKRARGVAHRVETARYPDDLARELEHERHAHQRAVADAEEQRRRAQALDRLSTAMVAGGTLDELLHRLLEIFVDFAQVDVGVVRLRDGDRLCSRAAVGLEDEVAAGFSLPVEDGAFADATGPGALVISSAAAEAACRSEHIRSKGVGALYCLPLVDCEQLVGVVYLGAFREHELSHEPSHALSGEQTQLLHDLATRAAAAVSRHAAHERLEHVVRSREQVLAIVAHDLRNPLSVITLAANSLLQRLPDSSARRPVERILRGAHRADRLIRDLLDISAIESGRFSIESRHLEMADVILAALESQQSLAAGASVILATDLSPELSTVEGDEERLHEVLENLIGNAIKFTGQAGQVTVGASGQGSEILVWVKDSGSGIAPDLIPHLFEPFWQATKTDRRGTGLGLTICKAIVEAHGGRIWVQSKVGAGTTMFFTIPAALGRAPRVPSVEVSNILMVDDRPENLLALKAILERPEYRLVTAKSGEEALSAALRERFAVALIDVAMPGMNGLEVAVHLKELERSRDIPIIFITAFGDDPEEIHRAYSAGGADYLVKPLDAEIVRKKVAVFVDLSRRRQGNGSSPADRNSNS